MKLRADQANVIVELIDSLEKIRDMFNNNDPNTNEDVEILTSNNRDYLLSAHNQINKFVFMYRIEIDLFYLINSKYILKFLILKIYQAF